MVHSPPVALAKCTVNKVKGQRCAMQRWRQAGGSPAAQPIREHYGDRYANCIPVRAGAGGRLED